MFVLIWATLLFSVKDGSADTGASWGTKVCQGDYCITLSDEVIRAEAGLCAVIPCSFTTSTYFDPESIDWFKCEPYSKRCTDSDIIFSSGSSEVQPGFRGRVTLLEPDIKQKNCSIIISDLTASDSGFYQLRVHGYDFNYWRQNRFQYSSKTTVSVTDLTQKPTVTVPPLTEGQQTTLSCTAPGLCSGPAPEITEITGHPNTTLPWTVAAFSFVLNVILIISVVFLRNKRKTVNPNQEDRTYMSLQKTDRSPEYDVIRHRLS